ncbi:MAG: membrane protein insertion efficiency factor YidD [Patescibacteria group bacterium]
MKIIVKLIKFYQKTISPNQSFFGSLSGCRFYPSCSEYSLAVIEKYGFWTGLLKSGLRILKCGPWTRGGVDFP